MARQGLLIKYQLQQQMATKDGKRVETVAIRSTRRSKYIELKESKNLEGEGCRSQPEEKDHHHKQIEEHKQQQICPKNEKESTSPPNNEPLNPTLPDHTLPRLTRSTALMPKKLCSELSIPIEPLTPEDNQPSKHSEDLTIKKLVRMGSAQSLPQSKCMQMSTIAKKGISKMSENGVSPYKQIRKSYRRMHKHEIVSIPYRKCHDAFEGRIVSIINKLEAGKNCLRDLETLIERIQRITPKDMMNRYIVAGIATLVNLSHHHPYDPTIFTRLQAELTNLNHKIIQEMDRTDLYQQPLLTHNQPTVDTSNHRAALIRKVYSLMKRRHQKGGFGSVGSRELREKAVRDCQRFFHSQVSVVNLIKFIKQKANMLQQ